MEGHFLPLAEITVSTPNFDHILILQHPSFLQINIMQMEETSTGKIGSLRKEIAAREAELSNLKTQLAAAEAEAEAQAHAQDETWKWPLAPHEYKRYSRQMIVPDFGLQGISLPLFVSTSSLLPLSLPSPPSYHYRVTTCAC